jgi:hypothetical protein
MFKRLQGFIIGFMVCALLFGGVAFAAELNIVPNPFPVLINGSPATVEGYNINGYTFLKLGDFKQAGLVVKFNETDKVIEITNETQALAPVGEVNTVSETATSNLRTSQKDGYLIFLYGNAEYINAASIEAKSLSYRFDYIGSTLNLYRCENGDLTNKELVLENVTYNKIGDMDLMEYAYFQNTILPLLVEPVEEEVEP